MKRSIHRSILMTSMLCLVALPGFAQEPEMVFLWEARVSIDSLADYEADSMKIMKVAASVKHPYPWSTFGRTDGVYYLLTPIPNWAEVDKFAAAWAKVSEKMGPEAYRQSQSSTEFGRGSFWMYRPDLSYMPDPLPGDPEKQLYRFWQFFYGKPGLEPQIEEVIKKFAALSRETRQPCPLGHLRGLHRDRQSRVCGVLLRRTPCCHAHGGPREPEEVRRADEEALWRGFRAHSG